MNIAKNQLITDESLIDKYLTNKEEAYIKTKQALYKHLKKFLKIELQHIIFIKYDITSITKYVLEKNNIKNKRRINFLKRTSYKELNYNI